MIPEKTATQVRAKHIASNCDVPGYEIHIDCIRGSYAHGIFSSGDFRPSIVNGPGASADDAS